MAKDLNILTKKLDLQCESGRKHDLYILYAAGKRIGQFGVTRSSKEKKLPPYAAKQLNISPALLDKILACFNGKSDVEEELKRNNVI